MTELRSLATRLRASTYNTNIKDDVLSEYRRGWEAAAEANGVPADMTDRKIAALEKERHRLERELEPLICRQEALGDIIGWMESLGGFEPRVERPLTSVFHQLEEAQLIGRVDTNAIQVAPANVFLIEHDWAKVLAHADELPANVRAPFPRCAWELQVSGRRVIAITTDSDEIEAHIFWRCSGGWWIHADPRINGKPVWARLNDLIKATCIMLEAEVAEHDVVRASEQLNRVRAKNGRVPMRDHHVIRLDNRHRAATAEPLDGAEPRRKRLHFRRGHWRHFDAHKTWIKWMLVGNPDLGFVDKEYRL